MKFIEIKEGVSISTDCIESIEYLTEFTSKVNTHYNSYEANFPYKVLIQLIEAPEKEEEAKEAKYKQNVTGVLGTLGHFAG